MAADIRVVLIKLADRLHNIKTLGGLHPSQRKRIAQETIDIYAPLANRLGMGELKGQLEDYAFPFLYPKEYKRLKILYNKEKKKREKSVNKVKKQIAKKLKDEKVRFVDIHGRAKHLFSLYRKLLNYDRDINEVYDLIAIRVLVKNIPDCYKTMGILHQTWKPLIGRIKDYIAVPKANGYQSLHTTTISPDGEIIEVQIRTPEMHEEAEYGIAAHWYYSENQKSETRAKAPLEKLSWIKQLVKWQKEVVSKVSNEKFLESLKIDVFKDRIFAFTPKGEILDLPDGATPVDFAYHIHTELGNQCQAVKVNDKLVSFDHKLENGDRVEIIKGENSSPSRDWLNFVKTNLARNQIKSWFKKLNRVKNIELGKKLLNTQLAQLKNKAIESFSKNKLNSILNKYQLSTLEDLFIQIAQGEIEINQIVKLLYKTEDLITPYLKRKYVLFGKPEDALIAKIEGESGLLTNVAKCCNPKINDMIKAHITRSKGASIHRANCPELKKKNLEGRVVNATWERPCLGCAKIEVETLNRVGMLRDLTDLISSLKINIKDVMSMESEKSDIVNIFFTLEIKDVDQLFYVLSEVKKVDGVLDAKKT
jgi:GTP pyrophosphokinase